VESTPFFTPSTSFCSLSSWFTSSCAYHLITVITFALIIYHTLDLSLGTLKMRDMKLQDKKNLQRKNFNDGNARHENAGNAFLSSYP